jgi:hypothetical protein
MADPMLEVAQAVTPLLAVGVDAALSEIRRQADAAAAAAVRKVLEQIRSSVGTSPSEREAADALRGGIADGSLTQADLEEARRAIRRIDYSTIQVGGNAYFDTEIRVEGGGSFHG